MTDDRPFTKGDAAELGAHLEKLFDAKLGGAVGTLGERITGQRNWIVAGFAAMTMALAGAIGTTPHGEHVKTAIALLRTLL
ncbi:MAG: hypothetical protein ACJ76I_11920 [Gaiellaceae bacterium]